MIVFKFMELSALDGVAVGVGLGLISGCFEIFFGSLDGVPGLSAS